MPIKTLIFDFGGVLYAIDQQRTLEKWLALSKSPERVREFVREDIFEREFAQLEKGEITPDQFRRFLRERFALKSTDEEIDDGWNATLIGLREESIPLVKSLKKKYRLLLLSNTNQIHYHHFEPQCRSLFSLFDKRYLSFEMGLRKPDREIFEAVIRDKNLIPEEAVLIDDSPENLVAPSELGILTYLAERNQSLEKLVDFLREKG